MTEAATQIDTPPPAPPQPQFKEHHLGAGGIVQWLLSVVVIASFVMTFIVQAFEIPSESMEKTLLIGDYLLVDKVQYSRAGFWRPLFPYTKIGHGDIIVFHFPLNPSQHFVKRVIGVPGDRIHISSKQVYRNGSPVLEPYTVHIPGYSNHFSDDFPTTKYFAANVDSRWWLQMKKLTEDGELIVPEGHYFVLGDNRDDSFDSRYWGFVPAENIVGRPLLIYWSVERERPDIDENGGLNAKLERFTNKFSRIFHNIRWKRTMTLVR